MDEISLTLAGVVAFLVTAFLSWTPIKNFFASKGWKKTSDILDLVGEISTALKDGKITEAEVKQLKAHLDEIIASFDEKSDK